MLGESLRQTYTIDEKSALSIDNSLILSKEEAEDSEAIRVQVMRYNIFALTEGNYIDPITMILGLSETDERIEMAIDELMEDKTWYQA